MHLGPIDDFPSTVCVVNSVLNITWAQGPKMFKKPDWGGNTTVTINLYLKLPISQFPWPQTNYDDDDDKLICLTSKFPDLLISTEMYEKMEGCNELVVRDKCNWKFHTKKQMPDRTKETRLEREAWAQQPLPLPNCVTGASLSQVYFNPNIQNVLWRSF